MADALDAMSQHILIAEDDPATRSLVADLLVLDGYEVSAAVNGIEALEIIRAESPDLVILDVMMPEADGLSVLRELRAAGRSELPVILLTAKADDQSTWDGWRASCNLYLTKPFEPTELMTTVAKLLEKQP